MEFSAIATTESLDFADKLFNNPALVTMLNVWSAISLSIAGSLMLYMMIVGTMSTAHEGEALGKNWHSMWIPIRAAICISMMLPLVPDSTADIDGRSAGQQLIVTIAKSSLGLADGMIKVVAPLIAGSELKIQKGSSQAFGKSMIASLACAHAHLQEYKEYSTKHNGATSSLFQYRMRLK